MTQHGLSKEIQAALARPTDGSRAKISVVKITPAEAHYILNVMSYPRQRKINPGHAGMLADSMSNNEFIPWRELTFAPDQNSNPILIDGQHRLQAATSAGWTEEWVICCLWAKEFDIDSSYIRLDTSQKERTASVIGHAVSEYQHTSGQMQDSIIKAASYQNRWDTEYELPPFCYTPPNRDCMDRVKRQMSSFEKADQVMNHSDVRAHIRRRLASPMVLAIMAETLHTMPQEAEGFWRAVAASDGGIASDLHSLLLEGKPPKTTVHYIARLAAQAWNQRASNGRLRRENRNPQRLSRTSIVVPT